MTLAPTADSSASNRRGRLAAASGSSAKHPRATRPSFANGLVLAMGLITAVGLTLLTRAYNPVWGDPILLWERGVQTDPASSFAHAQLGDEYRRAGRIEEAKRALARAVELDPDTLTARVALGAIATSEGRFDEAEQYLEPVVRSYPDSPMPLERLGVAYQRQGKLDQAIALFEKGRSEIPYKRAEYAVAIALLHEMAGDDERAIAELEAIRPALPAATDLKVIVGWWHLGQLHWKRGDTQQAARDFERLIGALSGAGDEKSAALRQKAAEALAEIRAASP